MKKGEGLLCPASSVKIIVIDGGAFFIITADEINYVFRIKATNVAGRAPLLHLNYHLIA